MKTKSILILSAIILSSLAFVSCGNKKVEADAMGMFEATEVVVSAKVQGEITDYRIDDGYNVCTGDTLGFIDVVKLNLQEQSMEESRDAQMAKILDLQEQTAGLEQQIANVQREYDRFNGLLKKGSATQKQVDDLGYQISVLKKQLEAKKSQLRSANKSVSRMANATDKQAAVINSYIGDALITTPVTGTIIKSYVEKGEYALPGKPLFKVADLSEMILRVYISADQFDNLKVGQKVEVKVDNGPKDYKSYEGIVSWIASKAEFTPKTIQTKDERANLVYAVKVNVKNNDETIKIGQYGECYFHQKSN